MSNIVSLAEHRPHMTGDAICMECRHQWVAVAEIGSVSLECPACGTHKATFVHPSYRQEADIYTCGCGNEFFVIHPDCVKCARCGVSHTPFD